MIKFITDVTPYGHPDFQPKLIGRSINVMISPLPRNKRAKNPNKAAESHAPQSSRPTNHHETNSTAHSPKKIPVTGEPKSQGLNNPFANLEVK